MASECAICFEDMTVTTGRSILGCGHTFHLRCVVAWFQEQECASSCPCCRREVGELDNVPLYPDDGEDDDADDGSEASEDTDEESIDSIEREIEQLLDASPAEEEQWVRAASGRWHLDGMRYISWGIEDRTPPPRTLIATMKDAATKVQALWRGHQIRRPVVGENE